MITVITYWIVLIYQLTWLNTSKKGKIKEEKKNNRRIRIGKRSDKQVRISK